MTPRKRIPGQSLLAILLAIAVLLFVSSASAQEGEESGDGESTEAEGGDEAAGDETAGDEASGADAEDGEEAEDPAAAAAEAGDEEVVVGGAGTEEEGFGEQLDEAAQMERMLGAEIPVPVDMSSAEAAELQKYREAATRYINEVSEYRRELDAFVEAQYNKRVNQIDRKYNGKIRKTREEVRAQRIDAIARLENFLGRHPDNDRYTPGVLYRLAVLHYEKADDDYFSADPATLTTDYPDFSTSIAYNQRLIQEYPDFPQLDGAYYLLGFCQQQMLREDEARNSFLALVQKYPESPKTPEALTRIGEYHFIKSQEAIQGIGGEEPQWETAKSYYEKAVGYGPEYAIYDRALYRLAWTEYYNENYDQMIFRFIELVEYADEVPQGSTLWQEAIEFMAAALAEEDWNLQDDIPRDPDFGMKRFDRYLNEGRPFELEVLRVYADTLYEQTRYDFAAEAYGALLARDECNPENPKIHQAYINALNLSEQSEKAVAVQSQLDQIYGEGSVWYECQEREGNLEAIAYAESISRKALKYSIGTFATEAQEIEARMAELESLAANSRGAQRDEYIAQIQELEKRRLEAHQKTARVTSEFLRRYPNDQDAYLYRYILADSYFNAGDYENAASTFEDVRDLSDGRFRRDAANGAIDSRAVMLAESVEQGQSDPKGLPPGVIKEMYGRGVIPAQQVPTYLLREAQNEGVGDQAAIEAELAAREGQKVEKEEIPEDVQQLIGSRDKYIEYDLDSRRAEGDPTLAEDYMYLNGVTYYHYGNYEQARERFQYVIDEHPQSEFAVASAGFLINTYEAEGDLDKVAEISDQLREKNLGSGEEAEELQANLQDIKYGALFEKAKMLFANEQYAEAAYEYERIANENPDFDDIHLALYNAGVAYEKIKRYESAMRLYKRVYTEYNEKPEAADALFRVGVNGERFFDFDAAVDSYLELHDTERESFQEHPERTTALRKAAVILKYTEDYERSARLFERYHDEHQEQSDAPDLLYEAALMHEKAGDYPKMAATFDKFRDEYGRDPDYRVQVLESYVKQGDHFDERDDERRARRFYNEAIDLYQSNPSVGGTGAKYFAAKAQFQIADQTYREWAQLRLGGSLRVFKKRVEEKKEGAGEVATKFKQVLSYEHPEWTMASLYRIGSMFHNFGDTMANAECPPSFDDNTCDGFLEGLLEGSFELKNKARENYEAVVEFGKNNNVVNEWTTRSLNGLNDIAPREYPMFEGERSALKKKTTRPSGLMRSSEVTGDITDDSRDAPKDLEEK